MSDKTPDRSSTPPTPPRSIELSESVRGIVVMPVQAAPVNIVDHAGGLPPSGQSGNPGAAPPTGQKK